MSTRHLMEIMYTDYADSPIGEIELVKDTSDVKVDQQNPNQFKFKEVLDGFNSFLEKKEVTIVKRTSVISPPTKEIASPEVKFIVVQFGAFSRYNNAVKLREKISGILDVPIVIHEDTKNIFKVMHANDITADSFSMLISKAKSNHLDFYVKN